MRSSTYGKMLAAVAILALIIAAAFRFARPTPPSAITAPEQTITMRSESRPRPNSSFDRVRPAPVTKSAINEEDAEELNSLAIPREKIEEYLKLHNRDAASLLAAFHASVMQMDTNDTDNPSHGDINYLKEAATNFPNDPHVQLTVLAQDAFPEARRKWLAAFKESSPSNSLANYLSAREYFKNAQPDVALKELMDASDKPQFANFELDTYASAEDLALFSGQSDLLANTAAMSAMSSDWLPQLAGFKGIAFGISDLQNLNANDKASVEKLSQVGLAVSERLMDGEGGRFIISQLVGMAVENVVLKSLDQNASYDFLGGKTPAQRSAELKQQKADFRELMSVMGAGFVTLPEAERRGYFDKLTTDGEMAAIRWLKEQHPTPVMKSGQ